MRKMKFLLGALGLGLGVLVGTLGVSALANPGSPGSFISKLRGQDSITTVTGAVTDPAQTPAVPTTEQNDLSATNAALYNANPEATLSQAEQQIVADYKQDIGIFFGAWKSADITTFRVKLSKAYTGELFETHAKRAEEYIAQGVGLDVSQITFDQVVVDSSDANTATLQVDCRYKARDYSLADGAAFGDEHEQTVKVRVNLIKQNARWIITGENTI